MSVFVVAGKEANMAKYLAAEASWKAADMCMQVSAQALVPGTCNEYQFTLNTAEAYTNTCNGYTHTRAIP